MIILNLLPEYFMWVIGGLLVWWVALIININNSMLIDSFVSIENIKKYYSENSFLSCPSR